MRHHAKTASTVMNVLLVLGLAAVVVGLGRPSGLIGAPVLKWAQQREARADLAQLWPALSTGGVRIGSVAARHYLVEFADYGCPYCREVYPTLVHLLAHRPDVAIIYHFDPLPTHPHSAEAALAALCASEQGQFLAMHAWLYTSTAWMTDPDWKEIARKRHIRDVPAFDRCMRSERALQHLATDIRFSEAIHMVGTPTFVSGDVIQVGALTEPQLLALLPVDKH